MIVLEYGPVSMLLIPMRRIYWYYKHHGDTATFLAQLLILLAIDMWLYVYCKYRDEMFSDGTKTFITDQKGAFVVKFTIETLELVIPRFLIIGIKWAFIFEIVIQIMIPACLMVVIIAMPYARQNRNHARRRLVGYSGIHLE